MKQSGAFTLIELIVSIGIIAVILSISTTSLLSAKNQASLNTIQTQLVSDLKQQQLKSVIGDTEGRATADMYGVHFDTNQYVFFHGTTYNSGDSSNYTVTLQADLQFNTTGNVIFNRGTGELASGSLTSIVIQNKNSSKSINFSVNQLGVITSITVI